MANIRGIQGGQAIPVAITAVESGISTATGIPVSGSVTVGASENHIGDIGGAYNTAQATLALSVAGAYATGDFVGVSGTPIVFTNAVRTVGDSGLIASALLIDKDKQSISAELWLFDGAVTPPNDNAAWSISDSDAGKCIGIISFSTYYASANNSVSIVTGNAIAFKANASTSIWGCLVTRGAPTYTNLGITIKLSIMQD